MHFNHSTGALKMLDVKMTDVKLTDQCAGHENAGHENAGHEIAGQEPHIYFAALYCRFFLQINTHVYTV